MATAAPATFRATSASTTSNRRRLPQSRRSTAAAWWLFGACCCIVGLAILRFDVLFGMLATTRRSSLTQTAPGQPSRQATAVVQSHSSSASLSTRTEQHHESLYTSPLEEFPSRRRHNDLPPPLAVLEQYKAWHSHEALLRDPHITNRTFIVAHYQCPISAGNWMHYFTSAVLWGVLTNRTVLWRYVTNDICHDIRMRWLYPFNPQRCNVTASDPSVCHAILTRAPWIPSFDDWKSRLQLDENQDVYMIPLEHSSKQLLARQQDARPMDVYYRDKNKYPVIDIHPWSFLRLDHLIYKAELRQQQLGTVYAHATLQQLAKWGPSFIFGLLWRYCFDYAPAIRQQVSQHFAMADSSAASNATAFNATMNSSLNQHVLSMAIHSRHTSASDDGCSIRLEQDCMRQLLQEYRIQTRKPAASMVPCQVTLASDRSCTIDHLTSWLQEELGCFAVVTQHADVDAVFKEHGPFSGSGYFQDMLLAGMTVKDAMIGSLEPTDGERWRSSSELIEEAITYHRDMTTWQAGKDPEMMPELVECTLKRMDAKVKRKSNRIK